MLNKNQTDTFIQAIVKKNNSVHYQTSQKHKVTHIQRHTNRILVSLKHTYKDGARSASLVCRASDSKSRGHWFDSQRVRAKFLLGDFIEDIVSVWSFASHL